MSGLKVKCCNCGRTDFETTDKYDPNATPNGSMVKCLLPYHIDWLTMSTTKAAEMTCPECLAQLAPSGRLTVLPGPPKEHAQTEEPKPVFICEVCGKELKTAGALTLHKRSHTKGEVTNG